MPEKKQQLLFSVIFVAHVLMRLIHARAWLIVAYYSYSYQHSSVIFKKVFVDHCINSKRVSVDVCEKGICMHPNLKISADIYIQKCQLMKSFACLI